MTPGAKLDRVLRLMEAFAHLNRAPTATERQAAYEALNDVGWQAAARSIDIVPSIDPRYEPPE